MFCEQGVFTPEESRRILEAGRRHGLAPRIHADELAASGGSMVAAEVGAASADHLIFTGPAEADAMARAGVVATLLPAAAFFLKLGRYAPARMFVERGVPVALATDMNPGGGFTPSMPFVIAVACFGMGLTLEEAIVGATANAAAALRRYDRIGSLEVGKQLDAVVLDGPLADLVRVGAPVVHTVLKRGAVVVTARGIECAMMPLHALTLTELLDRVASRGTDARRRIGRRPSPAPSERRWRRWWPGCRAPATLPTTSARCSASLQAPLADLRERLVELADEDTAAFDRLMAAYRLPKGTDEEKTARRAAIQTATRDATTVPLQTAMACARVLDLVGTVAALGNRSASSDLLVAMGLLRAAAEGAAANVRTNLDGIVDETFTADATARITAVLDEVTTHAHAATAALQG